MKMKKTKTYLKPALIALTLLLITTGATASTNEKTPNENKPVYFHYLVFWLKPDLTDQQVAEFTQFFEGLKKLPYQKNLRYGKPAASTPRAVLDQTYTYNASMEFDSLDDLEAYGKLPEHLALVAKYKPYFTKMLVHDTRYDNKQN